MGNTYLHTGWIPETMMRPSPTDRIPCGYDMTRRWEIYTVWLQVQRHDSHSCMTEQDGIQSRHVPGNSTQCTTYEAWNSGIFHVIFLGHGHTG